ncbi:MAG: hypothetical protein ACKO3G_18805 [Planctomycetaceae bacterium]
MTQSRATAASAGSASQESERFRVATGDAGRTGPPPGGRRLDPEEVAQPVVDEHPARHPQGGIGIAGHASAEAALLRGVERAVEPALHEGVEIVGEAGVAHAGSASPSMQARSLARSRSSA